MLLNTLIAYGFAFVFVQDDGFIIIIKENLYLTMTYQTPVNLKKKYRRNDYYIISLGCNLNTLITCHRIMIAC